MADGAQAYRRILVAGATGKQGGAVTEHLLARGFPVRALTRDASQPAARALASRGVEVVEGDLSEPAAIEHAVAGCDGVFSVQAPASVGVQEEIRQGERLADLAHGAGVRQFVYSSVGSADRETGVPHFDSKWRVEEHIRAIGVPHTILRPVYLMENWEALRGYAAGGILPLPLGPEARLQQVAVDDVGAFAARAFAEAQDWRGRTFEIAGDECTIREAAMAFGRALGHEVSYRRVPWGPFRARAGADLGAMYRWFEDVGYRADVTAVRRERPEALTLGGYLHAAGWNTH